MELLKSWLVKTGLEGFLGLGIGIFLLITGAKFWSGIAFGFFVTKNWDILKNYVLEFFKPKNEEKK